jgi:uncharacterized RDD family membrane protein YckC
MTGGPLGPVEPAVAPPGGASLSPGGSGMPPGSTGLPPGVGWAAPIPARREVAPGLVLSDTPSRLVAYLIDLFLIMLVAGTIAEPLGWLPPLNASYLAGDEVYLTTEYAVLLSGLGALYFVASWSGGRRATLGQRLFRIQVGNAFDGRPLTLWQAVRRWLGLGDFLNILGFTVTLGVLTYGLFMIWTIVLLITTATSANKQGLHDRIAGSAVVRPSDAGTAVAMVVAGIVVVLFVLAVAAFVAFTMFVPQVDPFLPTAGVWN